MTATVIGKLDYEGDTARIEGDSVPSRKMIAKVASFLAIKDNKLGGSLKGKNVIAQIIEEGDRAGWIEHIEELPLKQEGPACTSPATPVNNAPAKPASEFWSVLAVVETVDLPGRKATASDEQGVIHPLTWPAGYLDEKFSKLKPGYYRKFSGETSKPTIVSAVGYMGKDEPEWVKTRYKALHPFGGGGGGKPRNERLIVFQNMHTAALQGAQFAVTPDTEDYDAFMDMVYARAKKDTEQAMKDFGGV